MSSVPLAKILVVESDPTLRADAERVLRSANYDVCAVHTSAGHASVKDVRPDLVLLDVTGGSNGMELCRLIKSDPSLPGTVVLHVYKSSIAIPAFLPGSGCADGVLTRPFSDEVLLLCVASLLRLKRAEDRLRLQEQVMRDASVRARQDFAEMETRSDERELQYLSEFSSASEPLITATIYAGGRLSHSAPSTFEDLCNQYSQMLELRLEQSILKTEHPSSEHLRNLSGRLGLLRAGPRDLVELHTTVVKQKLADQNPQRKRQYNDEGRLMLLELMGYLADFYRDRSFVPAQRGSTV